MARRGAILRPLAAVVLALTSASCGSDGVTGVCDPGAPITVDYSNQGTFQTPSLSLGGLTVTGSANINVTNLNGLGIVGGNTSVAVDGAEFIRFSVDSGAASAVSYVVATWGNLDGDGLSGEAIIEAFDASATSLGVVAISEGGTKDVSAMFGNESISAFVVTADGDLFLVRSANFTPCL
jgi:hypothetical protein